MSDIIERLRQGEDEGVDGWWSVMAEGANEIERLRLELDMQQATILVPSQKDDQRRIERLDAALKEALDEAARLRLAMHDIYEVYAGIDGYLFDESKVYREQKFNEMADIAAGHKI